MTLPDDPFIIELLPEFLDTWINDVAYEFPKIIQRHDKDEVYRFGHTLKGSCFQFGLPETAELGVELMDYAKAGDWSNIELMQPRILKSFVDSKRQIDELISTQ